MSASDNSFRLYFKKLTNLAGDSLSSNQTRVTSFNINRDLLTKATSTIEILQIPDSMEVGDVIGVYDSYGTIWYQGVIESISDNRITADQLYGLFNDNWKYNFRHRYWDLGRNVANTLSILADNNDDLVRTIFSAFDVTSEPYSMSGYVGDKDANYVTNLEQFFYELYDKFNLALVIDVPPSATRPTILIALHTLIRNNNKFILSNNNYSIKNVNVNSAIADVNKLIIYDTQSALRATYYLTTSGSRTKNPSVLNRLQKINTSIVFSDDTIDDILSASLPTQMYNHEITLDMLITNNLFPFKFTMGSDTNDIFELGRATQIYFNDNFYDTIFTGYSVSMSNNQINSNVTMKFGKVRNSLTNRLYHRYKQ